MWMYFSSFVRALIAWSYLAVIACAFFPVMLLLLPSRRLRVCAFNAFGHMTGGVMLLVSGALIPRGIRARIQSTHPAIYVLNHTSYLDNFLVSWAVPSGTIGVAKTQTRWVPFFGQLYALSGNVLVNRDDRRQAAVALRTLITLTQRHGFSAMLFPEGVRSADGRLQPFKRGFAHLAIATRLPIVPIVVSQAHRCWPKGSALTRFARVNVQVLDPIPTVDWTAPNIEQHVTEVWRRFSEVLPEEQRPLDSVVTREFP